MTNGKLNKSLIYLSLKVQRDLLQTHSFCKKFFKLAKEDGGNPCINYCFAGHPDIYFNCEWQTRHAYSSKSVTERLDIIQAIDDTIDSLEIGRIRRKIFDGKIWLYKRTNPITEMLLDEVKILTGKNKENKRLWKVWMEVADDKNKEIIELKRELSLVWDLYGVPFVEGLNNLKDELKDLKGII